MAEVFGTVASALAVAELLAKSVSKVKKLWDEVQDVPDEVAWLIEQLGHYKLAVQAVEAAFHRQDGASPNNAAESALQACRVAVGNLGALAVDLQSQITVAKKSKRNIAKLKVSLKKDTIQKHQQRPNFIFNMLSMSVNAQSLFQSTQLVYQNTQIMRERMVHRSSRIFFKSTNQIAVVDESRQFRGRESLSSAASHIALHLIKDNQTVEIAVYEGRLDVVEGLISMGLSLEDPNCVHFDYGSVQLLPNQDEILNLFRLLVSAGHFDECLTGDFTLDYTELNLRVHLWRVHGLAELIIAEKFEKVSEYIGLPIHVKFTVIWSCVDPGTILHYIQTFGITDPLAFRSAATYDTSANLHHFCEAFMEGVTSYQHPDYSQRKIPHMLRSFRWGIWEWDEHEHRCNPTSGPRLERIVFGPKPVDWKLIWDPAVAEYVEEFWDVVENPPLQVPGAWVGDVDDW
ncbi:hypothetical protein CSOJ01_03395 [Colletotrichum sojae]|uniref:Fungal N-terminal domain-containing protein n=1 Tax=Colletotrichum sojae TaxID=2175907 RepID=A0A8H6JN59_9PEZI|nr:hypothetical protein CSOJ01_03395 [Colletotrichum sojae]